MSKWDRMRWDMYDRAIEQIHQSGDYMVIGRGVGTPVDRFTARIFRLSDDIRWLVNAAKRARNPRAKERLYRAAHAKRMERKAVERARDDFLAYLSRLDSLSRFGGQFADPPPE